MMKALIVLLGCLAAALAVPAHFPYGKTVIYKYIADVKAGVMSPIPSASQFGIECLLKIRHDPIDVTLKNAYYVTLTDVKQGLYNGHALPQMHPTVNLPIDQAVKTIQNPFLIVYNEIGQFEGVKFLENETNSTKNMKLAIASMLQLDLSNMTIHTPIKPHSFVTHENTIHGTCEVEYNVQPQHPEASDNLFVVMKHHEPYNCSNFIKYVSNHVEAEDCHVHAEEPMITSSVGSFVVENKGSEILIHKLYSHGTINYHPWLSEAEAHYLLTNQTLILQEVVSEMEKGPLMNFQSLPIIRDVSYIKPTQKYAGTGDVDVTQGRHTVNLDALISKVQKMLGEVSDYLKEDHMEMKQPDWKHGQTINRLLYIMSYMDVASLEKVYDMIKDSQDPKDQTMKNVFLGIVPKVGTTATCLFVKNVIKNKLVDNDLTAIMLLSKLPMSVKHPSIELLLEMEELLKFGETVSVEVKKASILCFATLIHQTFKTKDVGDIVQSPLLEKYLWHFMEHLNNEKSYEMKEVHLMAIKNVGVGNIMKLLEPIIRGDHVPSEKPYNIRIQAIWAIRKVVSSNPQYAHDLLWPILADVTLPTSLRIVAYDVLMMQLPQISLTKMYWFMVYEKNEHLYNYHLQTLKGLANSVDPCLIPIQELAKKLLSFSRPVHTLVPLSTKIHLDYFDRVFGHGETVKASLIMNQLIGLPYVGSIEHTASFMRKPVNQWGIHWNINGLPEIMKMINSELLGSTKEAVKNGNVMYMLMKAARDMPSHQEIFIDLCLTLNDKVVVVRNYSSNNWMKLLEDMRQWMKEIRNTDRNWQNVFYEHLFEMLVPTDLGMPAVLITKMPNVDSLKLHVSPQSEEDAIWNLKLELDYRKWKHGENAMLIYNPIADVWHSVRRAISQDIILPIEANLIYNHNLKSLKLTLPRLPVTKFSVSGISTHTKSYVTILNDEKDMLKKSCPTCHHYHLVSDVSGQKMHQISYDSKDLGTQYTMMVYDCENNVQPVFPTAEWLRVLSPTHKSFMGITWIQYLMGVRQMMMNDMISSQHASCSNMVKLAPSIKYPTSFVDLSGKVSIEEMLDPNQENLHYLSGLKINVKGTLDAKAAATIESVKQWDMNVNIDMSPGHLSNTLKAHITGITKGEKNLKMCIDAQKTYPVVHHDVFKVDLSKMESNTKMTITMGQTDDDKCVRDDMDVTMTMKGQILEGLERQMLHNRNRETCEKQMQDPLFHVHGGFIPRTLECAHSAIMQSTLRKYTVDLTLKKVPQIVQANFNHLQNIFHGLFFSHMTYNWDHVEPGHMKLVLEYPYMTPFLNMSVIRPTHGYNFVQLPYGDPVWNMLMDNAQLSVNTLDKLVHNQTKICTILPRGIVNFDNGIIPYVVSDQWTLLTGDYVQNTYAVLVKLVQNNKLVLKIVVGSHEVQITPGDLDEVVTVNGETLQHPDKGAVVPMNESQFYAIKLVKSKQHYLMHSQWVPLSLFYTANSVTVSVGTQLQGLITGLCGHMDGTHHVGLPKIYSTTHI